MPRAPKTPASKTHAARSARGRPAVTLSLPELTDGWISALAAHWGCSRSEAVARCVAEMAVSLNLAPVARNSP